MSTWTSFRPAAFFLLLILSVPFSWAQPPADPHARYPMMPDATVKNVIFFIGDGMGLAHLSASRMNNAGASGWYAIECMPVTTLVRTNSADNLVTDSASSGTAYATGHKTNNKMLGVSPDSTKLRSIVEAAREKGMATGLITMGDDLTGATPSAFAVHVPSRSMSEEIASQYADCGVDLLIGGGEKYFLPEAEGGTRKDGRNVVKEMEAKGYAVVHSIPELAACTSKKILGFIRPKSHGDDKIVSATEKALAMLSANKKGFFVMIECPSPDNGGHGHDSTAIVDGVQQLDHAVKKALDFAAKDKHTLVLVTADHETGGVVLLGQGKTGAPPNVTFGTGGHTPIPVPLFAFGPHAVRFTGMKDNTEVPLICGQLLHLHAFPAAERQ